MKGMNFIRVTFDAFPRRPWEGGGNEGGMRGKIRFYAY